MRENGNKKVHCTLKIGDWAEKGEQGEMENGKLYLCTDRHLS